MQHKKAVISVNVDTSHQIRVNSVDISPPQLSTSHLHKESSGVNNDFFPSGKSGSFQGNIIFVLSIQKQDAEVL